MDDQPWISLWDSAESAPDPRAARREAWAMYMASREWMVLKREVLARSGGRCERGHPRPASQVHHMTYIRRFKELPTDLLAVCDFCHLYLSGKIDIDPRGQTGIIAAA